MIQFIQHCGIVGLIILLLTIVLVPATMLVAGLSKHRRPLAVLALVALLPLTLGVLGTVAGYSQVKSARLALDGDDAMVESGHRTAREVTYLGTGCTAFLWLICGVAAITKKGTTQPARGH